MSSSRNIFFFYNEQCKKQLKGVDLYKSISDITTCCVDRYGPNDKQ